jgi:beta-lactamase class D
LGEHFEAEGVVGAFVGYDPASGYGWIHAAELAKVGYLPASTFKIANSIIALESGVVSDADFEIPWDGERRWNADWNYDATLKKAFRYSVVPYYQAVARRVGAQRMQDWLERLEYGNRDMSGALDTFWLRGGLRISALEQVDFLQRMNTGRLPISERTRGIVREIMFFGKRGHVRLHAKTGSTGPVEDGTSVGWFVGWVERDEARFYFATLLIDPPQKAWSARMHVSDRILVALGRLPGRPGAESD